MRAGLIGCLVVVVTTPGCVFSPTIAPGKVTCDSTFDCPPGPAPDGQMSGSGGDGVGDAVGTGGADGVPGAEVTDGPSPAADGDAPGVPNWPVCTPPITTGLDQGLVVYLRLDDGPPDPVITDSSPRHLSVMLSSQLDPQTVWTDGRFGRAVTLPGGMAGGFVTVGPPEKLNVVATHLSVSAWVRFPGGSASDGAVVSRRAAGAGGYYYLMSISNNHLRVRMFTSNGINADLSSNQLLPPGSEWMHLAFTYVADPKVTDSLDLFVNGKAFGSKAFSLVFAAENTPLLVGAAEAPNFDLPAKTFVDRLAAEVDEVAVYNRTLSPDEILSLACGARPLGPT